MFILNNSINILAVADGIVIPIDSVEDEAFSQKMMGDGYAIQPQSGEIYSPIDGIITTLFPTKHAIGIKNKKGLEILIHMGLDTVELEGDPFEIKVSQGQKVNKNQLIAKMNLKKIEAKEKKNTVIVVYTNMELLRSISEVPSGNIKHGEKVQKIRLKK
ncbi:PTS sugar transporter subunit IIA [Liquorilactobacillus nagelii]|uniref:PTS sugar transporter subunit IIA n=1 Tax=Liquorilactobacillus nagelii TaxID=82688 RepID=UPI001CC97473|nr:PTS glucose transporter subunit IIA [Liquorilactobacillus nagelii]ULQ48990.1 PTS glucose transporter subunit IIA [Liquorilactobacillus nagelii]